MGIAHALKKTRLADKEEEIISAAILRQFKSEGGKATASKKERKPCYPQNVSGGIKRSVLNQHVFIYLYTIVRKSYLSRECAMQALKIKIIVKCECTCR